MNVYDGIEGLTRVPHGSVLSIGNFDGVHLGHQRILQTMHELRDAAPATDGARAHVVVVTFEPHPLTVLRPGHAPPRLTPPPLKQSLLDEAGVDDYVILPPTREVLGLTAEQFWAILRDEVRPAHLVEGGSFNFGKDRGGTIERLREWSATSAVHLHEIDAVTVPLLDLSIVPVSSSLIRWLLGNGRVRDAAICLGRAYVLEGEVVPGNRRGKTIGIPTANLQCADQLVPFDGVYAGRCTIGQHTYTAAVSIGTNPTFGDRRRQVEAHLLDFDGDLYGRTLRLELIDWIREQCKFAGIEPLKAQIARDIAECRRIAGHVDPARAIAKLCA